MLAYNFLFCSLPAMIISLNGPQLLLFTGRIDKSEYLRRALAPYGAMEYLRRTAAPNDLILGANVMTAGYAPNPAAFHPMYLENQRAERAAQAALSTRTYSFLVARETNQGRRLAADLPRGYRSTLEYEDGRYLVFRLRKNH